MLAKALNIDPANLAISKKSAHLTSDDDIAHVQLLNFSILSIFLIPFGNLILPATILFFNRTNEKVYRIGKKILSFQIVSTLILAVVSVMIFLFVDRGSGAIPLPVMICYVMYIAVSVGIVFQTAMHVQKKKEVPAVLPQHGMTFLMSQKCHVKVA